MKPRYLALLFFTVLSLSLPLHLIAQWNATNGPYGPAVLSSTIQDTTLFMGTPVGVYRSTDRGGSWNIANNGFGTELTIAAMVSSGNALFAGTWNTGTYRSTDHGDSWHALDASLAGNAYGFTADRGIVYAASPGFGVFSMNDTDEHWTQLDAAYYNQVPVAVAHLGSCLVVRNVLADQGVTRSTDNGATWSASNAGLTNLNVWSLHVHGTELFAGTEVGVEVSNDTGKTWHVVLEDSAHGSFMSLTSDGHSVYAGNHGGGIALSTDDGETWVPVNNGLTNMSVMAISVLGTSVIAGTDGGFYRTTDTGAHWLPANTGAPVTQVNCLAGAGSRIIAGTTGAGLFYTDDHGETWTESGAGIVGTSVNALANDGTKIFAASSGSHGGIAVSTDNGSHWIPAGTSPGTGGIYSIAVFGARMIAVATDSVYYSIDAGTTWHGITALPAPSGTSVLFTNGGLCFASLGYSGVYVSNDSGATWTNSSNGEFINAGAFATSGSTLFAATYAGVYRLTEGSEFWEAVNTGITGSFPFLYAFALGATDTTIYAGTSQGTFVSRDNGDHWTEFNDGLPEHHFSGGPSDGSTTSLLALGNALYAGVVGRGVWRRSLSAPLGVETPKQLPTRAALEQNYPNPFNPTTTVRFDLPERARVTLQVYDLLGRVVATLMDEIEMGPGQKTVTWNPANAPTGVYFCRLSASSLDRVGVRFTDERKMILMR